jgi:hypothetical protein
MMSFFGLSFAGFSLARQAGGASHITCYVRLIDLPFWFSVPMV